MVSVRFLPLLLEELDFGLSFEVLGDFGLCRVDFGLVFETFADFGLDFEALDLELRLVVLADLGLCLGTLGDFVVLGEVKLCVELLRVPALCLDVLTDFGLCLEVLGLDFEPLDMSKDLKVEREVLLEVLGETSSPGDSINKSLSFAVRLDNRDALVLFIEIANFVFSGVDRELDLLVETLTFTDLGVESDFDLLDVSPPVLLKGVLADKSFVFLLLSGVANVVLVDLAELYSEERESLESNEIRSTTE